VEGFVHSVLGDFARHDRDGRTDLVRTLCVYFALGMNRKAAATRLGIHPNSLDYRLRQAVRVGGIDVTSAENSFRFQLAIRLLPICRKYPDWALGIS
jgi:DNA-binding PucR family transcriptional regulator